MVSGRINEIGDVGAGQFDPVKISPRRFQTCGNRRIGRRFIPQRAGENRRGALVAGEAQAASRVIHLRCFARRVIAHYLEFKTTGCVVVADDFEHRAFFVITEEQTVFQRFEARMVVTVSGSDDTRKVKKIGGT